METFQILPVPDDPKELPRFLRELQVRLARAAREPGKQQVYLGVEPDRPQDGTYFSEAGVLGVNRGEYRYDSTTGLYTFIA